MNPAHQHQTAEKRRRAVAALYLRGQFQSAIAQQLGVTQQAISKDLKRLRQAWRASALRDFDEAKALEMAKIDEAERAYWAGWERSLQQREVTLTKRTTGQAARDEASIRKETPVGDPRFLDGVMRCISQRCDLLGLSTSTEAVKTVGLGLAALLAQAQGTAAPSPPMAEA